MSSTYRILCISHDPALITGDYDTPEAAAAAITAGVPKHPHCDLLIGRYSYPLVEVGCPPSHPRRPGQGVGCYPHATTEWVDVAWLRMLAAVHQSGNEEMRAVTSSPQALRHWPWERLRRLRDELNLSITEATQ